MTQKSLSSRVKKITVFATVFLFVLVGIIVFEYVKIGNLKAEAEKLEQTRTEYEQQIEDLSEESEERKSRAYVEQYARDNLGMIKEGETIYKFK